MKNEHWTIYKFHFSTGEAYVGMTKHNAKVRLAQHKKAPCNVRLAELLRQEEPRITELSFNCTEAEARRLEVKHIEQTDKPVNKSFADGRRVVQPRTTQAMKWNVRNGRKYERSGRDQRCRWCKTWKTAAEYSTDRSRSSGLCSMCKECSTMVSRLRRRRLSEGKSTAEAYEEARKRVQENYPPPPRKRLYRRPLDKPNPCTMCGEAKAPEFFELIYDKKYNKYRQRPRCKACRRAYNREWHRSERRTNRQNRKWTEPDET